MAAPAIWLLLILIVVGLAVHVSAADDDDEGVARTLGGMEKLKVALAKDSTRVQSERNSDATLQTNLTDARTRAGRRPGNGVTSLRSKMAAVMPQSSPSPSEHRTPQLHPTTSTDPSGVYCDFESPCTWAGETDGFKVMSGEEISNKALSGPLTDADGNPHGHLLYLSGRSDDNGKHRQVYSAWYDSSTSECRLTFSAHVRNVLESKVQIMVETKLTPWIIGDSKIANNDKWTEISKPVGKIKQPFRLILEVWFGTELPSHAAFDNIKIENCLIPGVVDHGLCAGNRFECEPGVCIDSDRVCDFKVDCPNGEDESERCDQLAQRWNANCDFEAGGMCDWENSPDDDMEWVRNNGSVNVPGYGSQGDHTYGNSSGHFMYMKTTAKGTMGHKAILKSPMFLPPPQDHRNSKTTSAANGCSIRFFYRMFGTHKPVGSLALVLTVYNRSQPRQTNVTLWEKDQPEQDRKWHRMSVPLPSIHARYRLEFVGFRGLRHTGHISVDDVSLTAECLPNNGSIETYEFGTCGAKGPRGPTQKDCNVSYARKITNVTVSNRTTIAGVQQWIVPSTGQYSVSARGAGGGPVDQNKRPSRGSSTGSVFNLIQGEVIYLLVGQQGSGPCSKCSVHQARSTRSISKLKQLLKETKDVEEESGSGGGGATFVFKVSPDGRPVPLLVAAGGGGLAHVMNATGIGPDGNGENRTLPPTNGLGSQEGAGSGGGWKGANQYNSSGLSLVEGAIGGSPCASVFHLNAYGGFGGGGGGCKSGGGGGGYTGGDAAAVDVPAENGQGGYSFAGGSFPHVRRGSSSSSDYGLIDDGFVQITRAFVGCGCSYLCVVLTDESNPYTCLCSGDAELDEDGHTCLAIYQGFSPESSAFIAEHLFIILSVSLLLIACVASVMFFMYHRYRRYVAQTTRQEYLSNPEMQLNRLRQNGGVEGVVGPGMITEYNPNYEFGGSTCTLQDLREVPRENLSLVKALGQGAFGEVYQGCLANLPIPVAIKTLPELSSSQAEMDFLTEALIMSKFTHPNIVKFIGVCFDKMPKFIILELLPGGDLKSFLRESRPKPDKPSPMNMIDLLLLAIDVAKGCKYLEENHFIHRDIAARNCLLTSRDTKRVVKIADFGMARDIYRADYYRKGGKAMLPVKWMPPEAFLDGIFTSKTDVWSFGVLLWEVMSMGYMPYPGRGNQDVMQLVTSGGRLEPPSNCPQPIYHIMSHCWHPAPEERPNFMTILERLGYCLQDPDVLNSPLPVFHRPPSTERDTTVMRPSESDNVCLQVLRTDNEPQSPASTDYLIPIPSSSYSLCTEKTELQSASSIESVDHLLDMDGDGPAGQATAPMIPPTTTATATQPSNWETSFMQKPTGASSIASRPIGYQSVPTHEIVEPPVTSSAFRGVPFSTIAPPESSPARRSPPSDIARQRPSVKTPMASSGAGAAGFQFPKSVEPLASTKPISSTQLPLDPSTLTKQHASKVVPYANVSVSTSPSPTTTMTATRAPAAVTAAIPTPYTISAAKQVPGAGTAAPGNEASSEKIQKDPRC